MNRVLATLVLLFTISPAAPAPKDAVEAAFDAWLVKVVRPAARAAGVSSPTLDHAVGDLDLDWSLPDLAPPGAASGGGGAFQAEFTQPGRYLAERTIAGTVGGARRQAKRWASVLAAVEKETGVPPGIILGIWARESGFGTARIRLAAVRTLATHAFMGARKEIFLPELIAALRIVEDDHVPLEDLRSSWAGALGQPQFLPSVFLAHAVDGDGDGRRDIWTSVPDTLASIGRVLQDAGWRRGRDWGAEVRLPENVSCAAEGPDQGRTVTAWAAAGVERIDGEPLGDAGEMRFLLMPVGRMGPAFLVTENFYVLKRYNESDVYALFVGSVAERLGGGAAITAPFKPLGRFTRGDVRRLQERLMAAGHDVGGADGLVGFRTRIAIGRSQAAAGRPVTCMPDADLLE